MNTENIIPLGSVVEILTVGEVSRALGMSADRVRQLERIGVLPATRTATGVRIFSRSAVEAFRKQRQERRGFAR
ncbi:MerR family DNA-binding transcriptional regulator [Nitrospira sp. BLG_1]|uniref:MerR family DNA-binding transcriptional regulator n=1 Tax=Nitrospira sp. BLG_1 TaxID=3395883 RepID=UPI0039BD8083